MMSFTPTILIPEVRTEHEREFQEKVVPDAAAREAAWQEMHNFFAKSDPKKDWEFRYDFWRWYTFLTWWNIANMGEQFMVEVAMRRQIPVAFLLNFDIWEGLMMRLGLLLPDEDKLMSVYVAIKNGFFASPAKLGVWQGKDITVADMVKEVVSLYQRNSSSIEKSNLFTKLTDILFPPNEAEAEKYFLAKPERVVGRFVDLIHFFLGVAPEKIYAMADAYMHTDRYARIQPLTATASGGATTAAKVESVVPSASTDIRIVIDQKFSKNADGQYANVAGVMAELARLAEERGDSAIAEMYYFDESEGRFKWREEG